MQRGNGNGAREMPAAVLVVQTVIGEADQGFGRAARVQIAGLVREAFQAVGEGKIEPAAVGRGIGPECQVVGIAQVVQIGRYMLEAQGTGVPSAKDEDRTAGVVGQVPHARGEDSPVGRLSQKADAM